MDRIGDLLTEFTIFTEELGRETIIHPQHILHDKNLPVDTRTCTDTCLLYQSDAADD